MIREFGVFQKTFILSSYYLIILLSHPLIISSSNYHNYSSFLRPYRSIVALMILMSSKGLSAPSFCCAAILSTTSMPLMTSPNTV